MDIDVTLSQVNPTTGDIKGNTDRIVDSLERAEQDGSDVVVFPEMAITGYCIRDLIEDETFVDENRRALDYIRRRTGDTAVVVGVIDRDDRGVYNAAAVLQNGTVRGIARKVLLPNYRYFDDERYFEAGEDISPIQIAVNGEQMDLGVTVCEDMWDEEYDRQPITELADAGADLLININASPFEAGKRHDPPRDYPATHRADGTPTHLREYGWRR
ncbi:nitrilase-related carbon-nitrogen hydrolase [Haloferax mediterranei]|uniref:nitrilase-related carbon-nitrogen hydrolase n=1 Tax=Haloferax mediterranei TaxID=2252 RepID=UPI000B2263D6|nr:nitrilase-related carbon-nitrogen hydrolase [Haloferax mediterranei]